MTYAKYIGIVSMIGLAVLRLTPIIAGEHFCLCCENLECDKGKIFLPHTEKSGLGTRIYIWP